MTRRYLKYRRAAAMFIALTALMLVTLVGAQLLRTLSRTQRQSRDHAHAIQALWLADSGIARAAARLKADAEYPGEIWQPVVTDAAGRVEISISTDETIPSRRNIRVVATFPDEPVWRVQQSRETSILLSQPGESP